MTPHQLPVWVTRQKNLAVVTTQEGGKWVVTMCAAAASAMLGRKLPQGQPVKGLLTFVETPDAPTRE